MLVDPDNRGIKHLDICFADIRYSIQDAIPDANLSPSIEAVVAGRVRAKALRQIPPRRTAERKTQKMPFNTRRSSTRGIPRDLFGRMG